MNEGISEAVSERWDLVVGDAVSLSAEDVNSFVSLVPPCNWRPSRAFSVSAIKCDIPLFECTAEGTAEAVSIVG